MYSKPIQIGADADWVRVAAGWDHNIALKADGSLWAWGRNDKGQIGDGMVNINRYLPKRIGDRSDWGEVWAKRKCSFALREDGTLWGWGFNETGALGDGTAVNRWSPVQVGTDADWAWVSTDGLTTLGMKTDGTMWGWGRNEDGQVGDGTTVDRLDPVAVSDTNGVPTDGWVSFKVGPASYAIGGDGSLWRWGHHEDGDILGPTQYGSDTDWIHISNNGHSVVATKTDGSLWAWGTNFAGILGVGDFENRSAPTRVGHAEDWLAAAIGPTFTLGLKQDGSLYAWGDNDGSCALGFGDYHRSHVFAITTKANQWGMTSEPRSAGLYDARTITLSPKRGCIIADVLVDGVSVGQVDEVTFNSVTENHEVEAGFMRNIGWQYITATHSDGGDVTDDGVNVVLSGDPLSFTITPDEGYSLLELRINGQPVPLCRTYTFGQVMDNGTIHAVFTAVPDYDSDTDGLVDNWELEYFNELGQGPNDDYDGDGFTNTQECDAGTDPTSAASKPGAGQPLSAIMLLWMEIEE
jgi:alpha-tubulin suppressor-like RCC1 family protein